MRPFLTLALCATLLATSLAAPTGHTIKHGTCSGGANCTACSSCGYCKNCAKNGGVCSVCHPELFTPAEGGTKVVKPKAKAKPKKPHGKKGH